MQFHSFFQNKKEQKIILAVLVPAWQKINLNHKLIDNFNHKKKLEYTKKYRKDLYVEYMRNKDER